MQIPITFISKRNLEKVPKEERILFVQLSMLLTDINIFRKLGLFSSTQELSNNEVLINANLQISINLIFILCGILSDGWDLIDLRTVKEKDPSNEKYLVYLCKKNWFPKEFRSQLNSQGKKNLSILESYFANPKNKIRAIRNKISNHYDSEEIETHLNSPNISGITVFGSEKKVDTMFSDANKIFMYGFLDEIDPENRITAFNKFWGDEVKKVSISFLVLAAIYLRTISNKYLSDVEEKLVEVPDPEPKDNIFSNFFKDQIS